MPEWSSISQSDLGPPHARRSLSLDKATHEPLKALAERRHKGNVSALLAERSLSSTPMLPDGVSRRIAER
jgi:hypothetical protein